MEKKTVRVEQLSDDQQEIVGLIGAENYIKLVENFGGSCIYISKHNPILLTERNAEIKKNFNGGNYRELAKKYNLSVNRVRAILKQKREVNL
ncbi:MAG: DNA-binding protein [Ruminococcus sp.]|nr:DNA-binding protein [Ruminococcus sp.]